MYKMFWGMACFAYAHGLRELIIKAIDDPESDWDNIALGALDRVFNYEA